MDICIILLVAFVIGSSYLLKIKWLDSNNKQLLYVFAGILIIIIMKNYYQKYIEHFEEENNTLNTTISEIAEQTTQDWDKIQTVTSDNFQGLKQIVGHLKGMSEEDLNKKESQKLLKNLSDQFNRFEPSKLDYQLSQITTLLNNLQNVSNLTPTPDAKESTEENILENRSIKESQFLQDIEIKNLENELGELQKLYTGYLDKEAKKTYKKIPVYSSCVMEANGTTSKTQPKTDNFEFETPEQIKRKQTQIYGETEDLSSIDKLIKSVSQGGINISMQSK
jgi:hypothetical protein